MRFSKLLLPAIFCFTTAYAEKFVVKDVRVDGLQRITAGSFFNYLPVKRGDKLDDAKFSDIVRQLYQTHYFSDIKLFREGNTLVVNVRENPIIGEVTIKGSSAVKKKDLLQGLVSLGLGEGDTVDEAKIKNAEKQLLELYNSRSRYDVAVNIVTTNLEDGRVALKVNIEEGASAKISKIDIIGNKAFSEKELLELLNLQTSQWNSLFTRRDRFSAEKFRRDLLTLESYYMDRGFIDFKIVGTQVNLSENKEDISIAVSIQEGLPYKIVASDFSELEMISKEKLSELLKYQNNDYYSRAKVGETQVAIKNAMGDLGYAFAKIDMEPRVNPQTREIVLKYIINPGRLTYVRRIEFAGNYKTNDEVLRREMRQMESAVYNNTKIERSGQRLQRLGYITSVKRAEVPVPNAPDQVDVRYEVKEVPNRSITAGVGYGSSSGVLYNAGYKTANFFGTGNSFAFDFSKSDASENYSIDFTDPYFTADGISRTVSAYYNKTSDDPKTIGDWRTDNWGAFLRFGFPIDEYESFSVGGGVRETTVKVGNNVAPGVRDWLKLDDKESAKKFREFVLDFSWMHDTRDRAIFTQEGSMTRLTADVILPGSTETYYKLGVRNRTYFKLHDNLIASVRGDVSYGDSFGKTDGLPFFRNYYAGGLTTVRGFRTSSLGPRWVDKNGRLGSVKGGSLRVSGGAELIFPWHLGQGGETVRLGAFADFGNVYSSPKDFDADDLRYSAGLFLLWNSPIGPLNLSYGVPLNKKPGDQEENFQFTLGVPF